MPEYLIYTADYCSWCKKAKELMASKGIEPEEVDVSAQGNRDDFRKLGHKTIPQVYRNGVLIGGYDALERHLNP